jgi:hypothetical protein
MGEHMLDQMRSSWMLPGPALFELIVAGQGLCRECGKLAAMQNGFRDQTGAVKAPELV